MSYRPNFIGPDYIAPCPTCGAHADLYSRQRAIGNGPVEILCVYVDCTAFPYCAPGPCDKDPAKAIDGWNKQATAR